MNTYYITWHYTTHGVAYLKHILSYFAQNPELLKQKDKISSPDLAQKELESVFDDPIYCEQEKSIEIKEIIYPIYH
jgi:hypothetical protein